MANPLLGYWKAIQYSISLMNTFLLHCYFEWNVHFMYAYNLGVLDFLVCALVDLRSHSSFSTTNSATSVALESNLNRLIHFSHIKLYKCSIHSKFEIKIYFVPQRRSSKNETNLYSVWLIHGWITASGCACVFIKIHKYIASSRHQSIRRLNNLNRFVVGHRFRSLFV